MRTFLLGAVGVGLLLVSFLLISALFPRNEPDIGEGLVADAPVGDFGDVAAGDAAGLVHTFRLRNNGEHLIRIQEAKADCGCAVPQLSTNTVLPGEFVEVTTRVDWSNRAGPQQALLLLVTDPPSPEPFFLTLRGVVRTPVALSRTLIRVTGASAGETCSRLVRVGVGPSEPEVTIESIEGQDEFAAICDIVSGLPLQLPLRIMPGESRPFEVRIKAPSAPGRSAGSSLQFVGHGGGPVSMRLQIYCETRSARLASPEALVFMEGEGSPDMQYVTLRLGQSSADQVRLEIPPLDGRRVFEIVGTEDVEDGGLRIAIRRLPYPEKGAGLLQTSLHAAFGQTEVTVPLLIWSI